MKYFIITELLNPEEIVGLVASDSQDVYYRAKDKAIEKVVKFRLGYIKPQEPDVLDKLLSGTWLLRMDYMLSDLKEVPGSGERKFNELCETFLS